MDSTAEGEKFHPKLVASTGDLYNDSISRSCQREAEQLPELATPFVRSDESNYFKGAQWSVEGTTIVTSSADNRLRTFVLPPNLLDPAEELPIALRPYSIIQAPEPVYSYALYPQYSLSSPNTTLLLCCSRDHPIQLYNTLYGSLWASYFLVSPATEAYVTPHSLAWTADGTQFLTGSDSLICVFDISRPGSSGPKTVLKTIPSKRKKIVGGGVGMKGIVSSLSISGVDNNILAAGTFSRWIGLYDAQGCGSEIAVFSIAEDEKPTGRSGGGITQVLWSDCGRYFYVVERQSDGIMVYDIRAMKRVGWLGGRNALTNQRLGVELVNTTKGREIWAGDVDGVVKVWNHEEDGTFDDTKPKWEWSLHTDSVSSTIVHPLGAVFATCSGSWNSYRPVLTVDDDVTNQQSSAPTVSKVERPVEDNSLEIWSI